MPVDRATYRAWDGQARATRWTILAIAETMIRRRMKQKLVRVLVWEQEALGQLQTRSLGNGSQEDLHTTGYGARAQKDTCGRVVDAPDPEQATTGGGLPSHTRVATRRTTLGVPRVMTSSASLSF